MSCILHLMSLSTAMGCAARELGVGAVELAEVDGKLTDLVDAVGLERVLEDLVVGQVLVLLPGGERTSGAGRVLCVELAAREGDVAVDAVHHLAVRGARAWLSAGLQVEGRTGLLDLGVAQLEEVVEPGDELGPRFAHRWMKSTDVPISPPTRLDSTRMADSMQLDEQPAPAIDEGLYSRQLYVLPSVRTG